MIGNISLVTDNTVVNKVQKNWSSLQVEMSCVTSFTQNPTIISGKTTVFLKKPRNKEALSKRVNKRENSSPKSHASSVQDARSCCQQPLKDDPNDLPRVSKVSRNTQKISQLSPHSPINMSPTKQRRSLQYRVYSLSKPRFTDQKV
jgi:hypothetical protein